MNLQKISIITVCYNAQKTIEKTIQSVVNQSYKNIEYIIIDGQSNDKTLSILKLFQSKISKLVSESDSGIYNAMNKGINYASGEYLLFLNSDDYLLSHTVIENYMTKINEAKQADIFYGDLLIYDHTNGKGKIWEAKPVSGKTLYNSTLPHPSTIFKRSIFEELGNYDESYKISADHEFFVRAFVKNKKFQYINILSTLFSTGGVSTSEKHTKQLNKERQRTINTHFTPLQRLFLRIRVRIKKLFNF